MRTSTVLALALAVGCSTSDRAADAPGATPGGKADAWTSTQLGAASFASWQDTRVVAKHVAVGNGAHRVGTYDVAKLDAAAILAGMRARYASIDCPGRIYSSSRASAIATYIEYTDGERFQEEVQYADDPEDAARTADAMRTMVEDPTNRAVFSAIFDWNSEDDPAGCDIADFFVFRANGTVVHFNFDHAD